MRSLHLLLPLTVVGSALAGPLIAEIDDSHLEKEFAINNLETTLHMFNEFDSQSLRCKQAVLDFLFLTGTWLTQVVQIISLIRIRTRWSPADMSSSSPTNGTNVRTQ